MRKTIERDPEGLSSLVLEVTTQGDEHEGHETEATETLMDNSVEYTRWGVCLTCSRTPEGWVPKEFMIHSVTIVGGL